MGVFQVGVFEVSKTLLVLFVAKETVVSLFVSAHVELSFSQYRVSLLSTRDPVR